MSWLIHVGRMIFCIWPDRHRQRRALKEMDEDQLLDLGISRRDAMREGQKPFWR